MCARERRDKMSGKKVPHESDFKAGCNLCVISFFFFFFLSCKNNTKAESICARGG